MSDQFRQWLEQATRGLPPHERTRAAADLRSHFRDAVDAYRAQGFADDTAARLALADLGDAARIAHAFARSGTLPQRVVRRVAYLAGSSTRIRFGLLMLACIGPLLTFLGGADRHAVVVLLQTALLGLIMSIQLYWDELDVSLGVIALVGSLVPQGSLAVTIHLRDAFFAGAGPTAPMHLDDALRTAAMLGGAIGLLNGLLAHTLRRPLAVVTAVSALCVAVVVYPFRDRHHSVWSVYPQWTAQRFGATPVLYWQQRTAVEQVTIAVFVGVLLSVVVAYLAAPRGAAVPNGARNTDDPPWRARLGVLAACSVALLPLVLVLAWLNRAVVTDPPVIALALLVSVALAVIGDGLAATRACIWFTRRSAARREITAALPSMLRSTVCAALAATAGALITAHGMRDNTYHFAASFLLLVPLASLLVSGQHVLHGVSRVLAGIVGTLSVASLTSWPDDFKLNDDSVLAVVLAALGVVLWRWVLRPQRRAAHARANQVVVATAEQPVQDRPMELA